MTQGSESVIAHSAKGKVTMSRVANAVCVRLAGVIDEELDLKPLHAWVAGLPAGQRLLFDLGSVTRMNSCGVREWILLLERSLPAHVKIEIESVAQLIVEQANMIPHMLGKKGTPVQSFAAPYFCPSCKTEQTETLKPSEVVPDASGALKAPARSCKTCGKGLEFDWNEDEYFSFLRRSDR